MVKYIASNGKEYEFNTTDKEKASLYMVMIIRLKDINATPHINSDYSFKYDGVTYRIV